MVFFYVKKDEVNRKGRKCSEVQGNRKIHCIKPKLNESGILLVNTRSCYCISCIDEDFDNCQNKNYLDVWNEQQMKVLAESSTKVTRSEPEPDAERTESLADLASVGTMSRLLHIWIPTKIIAYFKLQQMNQYCYKKIK